MKYVLGIDIGTSGTKAALFSQSGEIVAQGSREYPLYQPKNGWAEQSPTDWTNATEEIIAELALGNRDKQIVALGLSGQMHGLVLLGSDNKPLCNSIIWCDTRAEAECGEILATMPDYEKHTANPPIVGFTLPKLLWVKNNLPNIYKKIHKILLPKDYVKYCLTGTFTTDVSDASGSGFFNVVERCWSKDVLSTFGIKEEWLPNVYESQSVVGDISKCVADKLGLIGSVAVVAGAGDQAASALGNGIVTSGAMSITLGSSGVVFAATSSPLFDNGGRVHTFCHAVPNMWHVMGVTQGAGISIKWFRDNFAKDKSYKELDELAKKSPIGGGLIFLPYLMGERTPHLDSNIRGAFVGLSAIHNQGNLYRAVLEGVAYSLKDCYNLICGLGVKVNGAIIGGGGAKSEIFREIIASCLGLDLSASQVHESGCRGVALLAMVGGGVYESLDEANEKTKQNVGAYTKCTQNDMYEKTFAIYNRLYSQLKDASKALVELGDGKKK